MSYNTIRPRSGTALEWSSANPVLHEREIGYEVPEEGFGKGTVKMKMGDGATAWNDLPYAIPVFLTPADIINNTETNDPNKVASAGALYGLGQKVNSLNTKLGNNKSVPVLDNKDLLAVADTGDNAQLIVKCNSTTLNTPYKDGLTGSAVSGTALIFMDNTGQYGQIIYFVFGSDMIFNRVKNTSNGWTPWKKISPLSSQFIMRSVDSEDTTISSNGSVYNQKINLPVIEGFKPYVISWFKLTGIGYANCSLSELWIDSDNNQIVYGIRNNGPEERSIKVNIRIMYINKNTLDV